MSIMRRFTRSSVSSSAATPLFVASAALLCTKNTFFTSTTTRATSSACCSAAVVPALVNTRRFAAEVRPGDWLCASCGENNFSFRSACNLCGKSKAADSDGEARDTSAGGGGGGGGAGGRPGDWTCPTCRSVNFKFRSSCFGCSEPKPGDLGAPSAGSNNPSAAPKPGDWTCADCGTVNFSRRQACFSCRANRPANAHVIGGRPSAKGGLSSSGGGPGGVALRPGDWLCVSCGEHNYAARSSCFRCSEPKGESQIYKGTEADNNDNVKAHRPPPTEAAQMLAGDWMCSCGDINFRRRNSCRRCDKPRPATPAAADEDDNDAEEKTA